MGENNNRTYIRFQTKERITEVSRGNFFRPIHTISRYMTTFINVPIASFYIEFIVCLFFGLNKWNEFEFIIGIKNILKLL